MIRQQTSSHKKTQSLLISCLLHALILMLILASKYKETSREAPLYQRQKEPAPVQLQQFQVPPPAQTSADSDEVHLPSDEGLEESSPLKEATPPSLTQSLEEEMTQERPIQNSEQNQHTEREEKSSFSDTGPIPVIHNEAIPLPNPQTDRTRSWTAADFMQLFKEAVQKERHEADKATSSYGAHVQDRLNEWKEHHYKQRIIDSLRKASKLSSHTMNHYKTIDRTAQITIPILKDGSLGDMSQYPMSGIYEVDRYLIRVFNSADFPPIPDRYKTNQFLFTVPMRISLKKGSATYNIFVS